MTAILVLVVAACFMTNPRPAANDVPVSGVSGNEERTVASVQGADQRTRNELEGLFELISQSEKASHNER